MIQLYFWTHLLVIGTFSLGSSVVGPRSNGSYSHFIALLDANTIGTISAVGGFLLVPGTAVFFDIPSSLAASIDWGCAVQIAAAASIGSPNFVATQEKTLCVTQCSTLCGFCN